MSEDARWSNPRKPSGARSAFYLYGPLMLVFAITAGTVVVATHSSGAGAKVIGSRNAYGELNPVVSADLSEFTVKVSQFASAPAGDVTFMVKNAGGTDHEMIVLKTDKPFNKLPIIDSGDPPAPTKGRPDKVDETDSVGETGGADLKPGETRTFTLKNMAAGNYVLVCNLASHYGLGMRAAFKVTDPR